jgi:MerR family transcriptional regulator, thiopeptide resistance regulator
MSHDRPATIAKRLGIGAKALRLWEEEGLIKPHRLANGWRVFRAVDVVDAWRITSLKSLGFSLRAIKALLSRGTPSFEVILSVQDKALSDQLDRITRAKSAIAKARDKLAQGQALDVDALIHLHQETSMSQNFINPVTEKLWEQTFTKDQLDQLAKRDYTEDDAQRVGAAWAAVIAEADKLRIIGDPASPEALDLGRRWFALVREFTGSAPDMVASSRSFYENGFADAQTANHMPFSKEIWDFVSKIAGAMIARGETIT